MRVDDAVCNKHVLSPNRFVELIDRHYVPSVREQRTQQLQLQRSDLDRSAILTNLTPSEIDLETVEFVNV